jgi:lysophospholipase L1-like esterase
MGSFHNYRKELREFKAGINLKEGYDPWADPIFLYWKIPYYDYLYSLVDRIVGVMQDFCRQKGIRLLFGLGAVMQQFGRKSASTLIDYDLPRRRLVSVLEKNNVAFVDMKNPMLVQHTKEQPVIFDDGHMNARGHRLFAEELHKDMVKRGWLN